MGMVIISDFIFLADVWRVDCRVAKMEAGRPIGSYLFERECILVWRGRENLKQILY